MSDAAEAEVEGTGDATTARSVLEYLVRALVEDADAVHVELDDRSRRAVLNVHVGPGDMGRVIGKRGRVANAIRAIGRAAAAKDGESGVAIEFVD